MIQNVNVKQVGSFQYTNGKGYNASANFPLFIIRMAWENGCDMESLADGFGKGNGTMGGDWSGIRDSSEDATNQMLQEAINFIQEQLAPQDPEW